MQLSILNDESYLDFKMDWSYVQYVGVQVYCDLKCNIVDYDWLSKN